MPVWFVLSASNSEGLIEGFLCFVRREFMEILKNISDALKSSRFQWTRHARELPSQVDGFSW